MSWHSECLLKINFKEIYMDIMSPITTIDALNKTLDAPALDPVLLAIANDYLAGNSIPDIASDYGISTDRVTAVIEKREVKTYIDNTFATQGYLNRAKRLDIINKVIEAKLEEALESGVYSKKDLLDWMKHAHDLESAIKPKENKNGTMIQINNYDGFMEKILRVSD